MDNIISESIIDAIQYIREKLSANERGLMELNKKEQAILDKNETLGRVLMEIDKKAQEIADKNETIRIINEKMDSLSETHDELLPQLHLIPDSISKISNLEQELQDHAQLMHNPPARKDKLTHRFNWTWTIAIVAIVVIAAVVSMWAVEHQKLNRYIANDTKYRSLKVMDDRYLQQYLQMTDSIYRHNPNMRKAVFKLEEDHQRKLELLRQSEEALQTHKRLQKEAEQIK